jgi:hypothetical protein
MDQDRAQVQLVAEADGHHYRVRTWAGGGQWGAWGRLSDAYDTLREARDAAQDMWPTAEVV